VVPHITIQSLHLRVGEFESHLAKRLLQQYRPIGDITLSFDHPVATGEIRHRRTLAAMVIRAARLAATRGHAILITRWFVWTRPQSNSSRRRGCQSQ
jgi:hypothetical protein